MKCWVSHNTLRFPTRFYPQVNILVCGFNVSIQKILVCNGKWRRFFHFWKVWGVGLKSEKQQTVKWIIVHTHWIWKGVWIKSYFVSHQPLFLEKANIFPFLVGIICFGQPDMLFFIISLFLNRIFEEIYPLINSTWDFSKIRLFNNFRKLKTSRRFSK